MYSKVGSADNVEFFLYLERIFMSKLHTIKSLDCQMNDNSPWIQRLCSLDVLKITKDQDFLTKFFETSKFCSPDILLDSKARGFEEVDLFRI